MDSIFPSLASLASLTVIGLIFGLILSIAKIKLHVEKDPKIGEVDEALPGANCGACGFPGCGGYATNIVEKGADITLCPVGGDKLIDSLATIMGIESSSGGVPLKATVHCHGGLAETSKKYLYNGPQTCLAAHQIMDGFKVCSYGCLGMGDCDTSCPFDAITMNENGIPVIDKAKCTGCNKCVLACPRDIISLVPENFEVRVMCINEEKTPVMKKGCSVGCIGCKLCEKACIEVHKDNPDVETAIVVNNFCATIDYDKCTNCLKCAEVCPVPVINPLEISKKWKKMQEKKAEVKA